MCGHPEDTTGDTTDNAAGDTTGNTADSAIGNIATNIAEIKGYVEILNKAVPQIISETQKWIEKAATDTDIYWLLRKAAEYVKAHK